MIIPNIVVALALLLGSVETLRHEPNSKENKQQQRSSNGDGLFFVPPDDRNAVDAQFLKQEKKDLSATTHDHGPSDDPKQDMTIKIEEQQQEEHGHQVEVRRKDRVRRKFLSRQDLKSMVVLYCRVARDGDPCAWKAAPYMPYGCPIGEWDVSSVTNMGRLFASASEDCADFNEDLSGWHVSSVTNMKHMFYGAFSFNQDLSGWDVSSVMDMSYMFYFAESFNQDLNLQSVKKNLRWFPNQLPGWDVSSVTDMSRMFAYTKSFNQDLSRWNVSSVTDMSYMFLHAESFNQDLSQWNVSSVTTMSHMFASAKSFNQDLCAWAAHAKSSLFDSVHFMFHSTDCPSVSDPTDSSPAWCAECLL